MKFGERICALGICVDGVNPNKGDVDPGDLLRDWGLVGGDCDPSEPVPPALNKLLVTGVVVPRVPAVLLCC
jgi:hypothetical protein